tara:strand:- start:4071 stop:4442 length:372 start_codon:yes stop_codon:yes gene_type:complete
MWLTFDWDDVSLDSSIVNDAMGELVFLFSKGNVWYRTSSSGTGLHLVIANLEWDAETMQPILTPKDLEEEIVMSIRKRFRDEPWNLECNGRLRTDFGRQSGGTVWGRVFTLKNGNVSGEWLPC